MTGIVERLRERAAKLRGGTNDERTPAVCEAANAIRAIDPASLV